MNTVPEESSYKEASKEGRRQDGGADAPGEQQLLAGPGASALPSSTGQPISGSVEADPDAEQDES